MTKKYSVQLDFEVETNEFEDKQACLGFILSMLNELDGIVYKFVSAVQFRQLSCHFMAGEIFSN